MGRAAPLLLTLVCLVSPALAADPAAKPAAAGVAESEIHPVAEWIRDRMPEALREKGFLLEHWQWLALLASCFLAILVERLVTAVIPAVVSRQLARKSLDVDRTTARSGFRPFGLLAGALLFLLLLPFAGLPDRADAFLQTVVRVIAAVAGVWAAYRLVDVVAEVLVRKAEATRTRFDDLLIPLLRKTLKVFVTVVGLVFVASVLDINVTSLLGGLAITGLAIGMAAKDTIAHLFGSLTVILDRPFQVGDWVKIGDSEGTVEEVGFRSTRVRTFYNSVISIPNSNLITAVVDNMGMRRYRRIRTVLPLDSDTPPEKVDAFCEGIRELIRLHPYTRKDYFHVYLTGLGEFSLEVLLYTFVETPDWSTELREKHRLFADILRLARGLEVGFAFPTQTVHLAREPEEPAPPASPPGPEGDEAARTRGRDEARAIVTAQLGDPPDRPPPVEMG